MAYTVRYVSDRQMPDALGDYMFVKRSSGGWSLLIRESAVSPDLLTEVWAAYRALASAPMLPAQRPQNLPAVIGY